jgi:hypothetical protein
MAEFQYKYYELFNPCLQAIRQLGGSGTNREVEQEVSEVLGLTEDEINDIHRGNVTKLSYRLDFFPLLLRKHQNHTVPVSAFRPTPWCNRSRRGDHSVL